MELDPMGLYRGELGVPDVVRKFSSTKKAGYYLPLL